MQTSEFVAQARDEISMGWVKGSFRNTQGVCVMGALDRVAMKNILNGGIQAHTPAQSAIQEQFREMFPDIQKVSIPGFNDSGLMTKQDILNGMDKTIIGLEEKGL